MDWILLIVIVLSIIFASVTGYREVQILVERKSWTWENYRKWWFWFTNQTKEKEKNEDSFHISNGIAFTVVSIFESLILFFVLGLNWYWLPINTAIFWVGQFWIRNIWMHVILKKEPLLYYLIPVFGVMLKDKFIKQ